MMRLLGGRAAASTFTMLLVGFSLLDVVGDAMVDADAGSHEVSSNVAQ